MSPNKIKAIETKYNNILYRSRIEARWAVFFTVTNTKFIYEPEGYVLENGTCYLPDFYLPKQDCYFEIKGGYPTFEEKEKCAMLSLGLDKNVFIAHGDFPLNHDEFCDDWMLDGEKGFLPFLRIKKTGALHQVSIETIMDWYDVSLAKALIMTQSEDKSGYTFFTKDDEEDETVLWLDEKRLYGEKMMESRVKDGCGSVYSYHYEIPFWAYDQARAARFESF